MSTLINSGTTYSGLTNSVDINDASELVIFVGQNPSSKPTRTHTTFGRLNEWVDKLGLDIYTFINACSQTGNVKQKHVDLDNLRKACYKGSKVIALGNFADEALTRAGVEHFKLPHPSPLNRQINDNNFINSCLDDCREYLNR